MGKSGIIKNLEGLLAKKNMNPDARKALERRLKDVKNDKPVEKY